MGVVLQRFEDPAMERDYLRSERTARGTAIRSLIVVSVATLLSYIVLNPMHFPREGVIHYTMAATALIAGMLTLFFLSRTQFYLDHPWIDLPMFAALAAAMKGLTLALAAQAEITGFPPQVMALVQMGILVVFASIGFAGTVRYFLVWSFAVLAIFAAWLHSQDFTPISRIYTLTNFSTFFVFALYFNWDTDRRARSVFAANRELAAEREKTEALLYNVLPQEVVARLKSGKAVADSFSDLSVVFADLVGFSGLSKRLSPGHLVRLLNDFFSAADRCAERHGMEKVKTIGDAYLAVCGGMASDGRDSAAAIGFAQDLIADVEAMARESGIDLQVRIGVHTGPVIGGVIGSTRLAYDYWGDTMNVASRLQGIAPPGGIAVSEATYFQTRSMLDWERRREELKGIGETDVYVARPQAQAA
ncbi:adenylate/guanylate cyclase domain-containing protein [Allosphingosinicella sp.]|jgi:class 3 adenylate cyclase|uniref:adenylate/guanylate cyclase domain-containing protein n=1 Tax=Allosphingosinicella sp. TaxID=2823234 RepID=UPI002F0E3F0D